MEPPGSRTLGVTHLQRAMVMGRSQSMPKLGCLTSLKRPLFAFFAGELLWGRLLILYKSADYSSGGRRQLAVFVCFCVVQKQN